MPQADHRALRRRLQQGDESALDTLIDHYWEPVVRFVRTILGDVDLAEDVAQETFVRFWANRDRLRGDGSLQPFLFRIARNAALDERRQQRRIHPLREEALPPVPEFRQPDATVELGDLEVAVNRAVAALPPKRRQIFMLARTTDFTYAQIADVLGVSPQTVANQMSRALADLRTILRPLIDGE